MVKNYFNSSEDHLVVSGQIFILAKRVKVKILKDSSIKRSFYERIFEVWNSSYAWTATVKMTNDCASKYEKENSN